ncbi:MAG: nicotinate (nicotinamide) nucleotide adenylyltransferase, partial [Chloroflexota bacterium]|nr:nicotinate (nicotinamide) nucleotide adenylyltransferase [Chloroflexota bacterium]
MDRLGVYGGTFDPVHCGHLAVARSVREAYDLSRILFIPARQSPLRDPPQASARDRLAMVRRAIDGMPGFEASAIDIDRPGPSYMIDTLTRLAGQHPRADLFLILGADAVAELPAWREADRILAAAQIIAVPRPGH